VELKSILASCEAPSVKEEDFDDSETNESEPARTRPAAKRKNTASTLSLKVEQIWKRHCAEREQEHETKMAAMRSRLATLKKSMNELRKEMTSLETEISEAEERRQEEVEREKELGKRFDQSSTEDEAANRTDSADAGADGTNGSMEQTEGMESGTVEQTDGPVICDNLLAVSCTEVENVEIPPDSEAVEIVIDNIGTVLMNVDNNTWM
jgi:predicted nuclease with TOPRIM domain